MGLTIKNSRIVDNKTGIKAPSSADIDIDSTDIKGNHTGIDIYVTQEDIIALGLPKDTNIDYVIEAIQVLKENSNLSDKEKEIKFSETKLSKWLEKSKCILQIGLLIKSLLTF